MICRKTMEQCQTPGMCSPFGGCGQEQSQHEKEYDALYADWEYLKNKNKELLSYYERYKWLRSRQKASKGGKTATVVFWLGEPYEPEDADELDRMIDNFLDLKK